MNFMSTTWFFPVAVSIWVFVLTLFLGGYFYAMRPPTGTLQWIACFDPPKFAFAKARHPLTVADGFWLAVVAAFGAVANYAFSGILMLDTTDFVTVFFQIANHLIFPALACSATFWLVKSMTDSLAAAFWAGIMVGLDVFVSTAPVAVIALVVALIYGYSNQPHQADPLQRFPLLALTGGIWAAGLYFYGGLLLLLIPIFVIFVLVNYEIFLETGHFWRSFTQHLGMFALAAFATWVGLLTPVALVYGQSMIGTYFHLEFYQLLASQLYQSVANGFGGESFFYAIFIAFTHWPLLLAGLFTVPTLCYGAKKQGKSSALLILLFGATIACLWLTTNVSALFYGVALGLTFAWNQLKGRKQLLLLICWPFTMFLGILSIYLMILV